MRRFLVPLVALACMLFTAQVSKAVQTTFAAATAIGSSAFVYTTGVGGGLSIAPASVFTGQFNEFAPGIIDPLSTFAVTGLVNTGIVSTLGGVSTQTLTGGSFTLTNASSVVTLSGTFTGATLSANAPLPSSQASFLTTVLGVTYTGGTYFAASGLSNPGGFSFGLTSVTPAVSVAGTGYFTSFVAGGAGTFSAGPTTSVPEPMTAAAGLMGLPVLALWAKKRIKNKQA
jgi:hypothetical protein